MNKSPFLINLLRIAVLAAGLFASGLSTAGSQANVQDPIVSQSVFQSEIKSEIINRAQAVNEKVIAWRRHIHAHPELGNREFKTAELVAEHLRSLGFDEVKTGVAHTGVVGILKGGKPGAVIALRADMDALPVSEKTDLPFASKATTTFNGQEVGVMHACGHDTHVAMLMGAAQVLADMREQLSGTVKFIFQPAEEGPPAGEEGGAHLMIQQGVLENPRPDAVFGLHVFPGPVGQIQYTSGGAMAGLHDFSIRVKGQQTHGAEPWKGKDPITTAAQIITALQTIPARQLDVTGGPVVISIGSIHGGNRNNIIPDEVVMKGTARLLNNALYDQVVGHIQRTAEGIAASAGLVAEVEVEWSIPVVYNDPKLLEDMLPVLNADGLAASVAAVPGKTPSEDFAFFQQQIPGLFLNLGINPEGVPNSQVPPNHSPYFKVNEDALISGVKVLSALATAFLNKHAE